MGRQAAICGSDSASASTCATGVTAFGERPEPAGRVDPLTLPAKVDLLASQMKATIDTKRVTFRRGGDNRPPLYITVPMSGYRGVVVSQSRENSDAISLVLRHANPELDVPLLHDVDDNDVVADWQSWARVLDLPALMEDEEGKLVDPYERFGKMIVARPRARRANTFFRERRPNKLMHRKVGGALGAVLSGEREIIARD